MQEENLGQPIIQKEKWLEVLIKQAEDIGEAYEHVYMDDAGDVDFDFKFRQLLEHIKRIGKNYL